MPMTFFSSMLSANVVLPSLQAGRQLSAALVSMRAAGDLHVELA
jgi:hypothetical protein